MVPNITGNICNMNGNEVGRGYIEGLVHAANFALNLFCFTLIIKKGWKLNENDKKKNVRIIRRFTMKSHRFGKLLSQMWLLLLPTIYKWYIHTGETWWRHFAT